MMYIGSSLGGCLHMSDMAQSVLVFNDYYYVSCET